MVTAFGDLAGGAWVHRMKFILIMVENASAHQLLGFSLLNRERPVEGEPSKSPVGLSRHIAITHRAHASLAPQWEGRIRTSVTPRHTDHHIYTHPSYPFLFFPLIDPPYSIQKDILGPAGNYFAGVLLCGTNG